MARVGNETRVDAVIIGRNEGARLIACLQSVKPQVRRMIYVDSGSTDDSVAQAGALGAEVIALDTEQPFTAARARNAGLRALRGDPPEFVQFIDGDCVLRPGWITAAVAVMDKKLRAAVVCGRRREMHPEASIYNALIDAEWNTPVGEARACGGDALMRFAAVNAAGGFRDDLIAGEEPELCLRLRRRDWAIWRIDAEMTLHDAAITRFGQWWRRTMRAGHAFAEGAARFSTATEPHWQRETRRLWLWGLWLPLGALAMGLMHPAGYLLLLVYPAQMVRLSRRMGFAGAFFSIVGKLAEAQGALSYHLRRNRRIIEYK